MTRIRALVERHGNAIAEALMGLRAMAQFVLMVLAAMAVMRGNWVEAILWSLWVGVVWMWGPEYRAWAGEFKRGRMDTGAPDTGEESTTPTPTQDA